MSCKQCSDGQREPALLQLIRNRTSSGKTCSLPEYCTMRECIEAKAGEDATISPEYWDKLNDILQRLAALENNTGMTIEIPGGTSYLTSYLTDECAIAIPESGTIKSIVYTTYSHSTIQRIVAKRNGVQFYAYQFDTSKHTIVTYPNISVVRGDFFTFSGKVTLGTTTLEMTKTGEELLVTNLPAIQEEESSGLLGITMTLEANIQVVPLTIGRAVI